MTVEAARRHDRPRRRTWRLVVRIGAPMARKAVPRVDLDELRERLAHGEPVVVLDVRGCSLEQ